MVKVSSVLGIDIAQDAIRIVEVEPAPKGLKVRSFASVKTPPDCIKDGVITKPDIIGKAISSLLAEARVKTKKAVISIRSPHAFLRLSRIPFMPKPQTKLALKKEIGQYSIFQNKEPMFDMHIVEEISEAGVRKMNVLYGVATREICNSYIRTAEAAELDLMSIDTSPLAVLRCINRTNLKISGIEAPMLVIVNPESIDIIVLKGEKVRYCHTAKIDAAEITGNIDGFMEKLSSAVKLVMNFYQAKYTGGESISKIVLSCDTCPPLTMKNMLEQTIGELPIEVGDSIGDMIIDEEKIPPDKIKELASFTCAIGTALEAEGYSSFPVRFNLIPKERFEKLESTKLMRILSVILSGILLIFLICAAVIFITNIGINKKIANLQRELDRPDPLLVKVNSIFDQKSRLDKKIEDRLLFLSKLYSSVHPWDKVLINAMARIPEELLVTKISSEGEKVVIKGKANSEKPIFDYVKSLDKSFYATQAKLVSSQNIKGKGDKEELNFTIECLLKKED